MAETVTPVARPGGNAWILAARIPTLPAAATPVFVGTAVGVYLADFRPLPFLGALLGALLIQIATNFANDYFDYRKGADTQDRLGPVRATSAGLISPEAMKRATWITFGLAALVGLYLIAVGGLPILIIGLLSILFGIAYTGGPYPLGYNGLGDIFVFLFFGLVAVAGSAYLQTGSFNGLAIAAAVPIGLLVNNILVINNLRDVNTDRVVGKRTLAVRIGESGARMQYAISLAIAYAMPVVLWQATDKGPGILLPLLTIPLGVMMTRTVLGGLAGRPLNAMLKKTGQLLMLYGILFSVGFIL